MAAPLRLITPEHAGFERLLGSVLRQSHCFALQLVGDRETAELLLQQGAGAALGALRREEAPADFRLWFLRILADVFQARYTSRPGWRGAAVGTAGGEVTAAFQELPPDERLANALYFAADLRYAEIAWVLRVPVPVVRARLHRGRRALLHLVAGPAGRS